MASSSNTTLEDLQKEVSAWESSYDKAPKTSGPAKWRLHADFMHSTYSNIVVGVVQRQEQAARAERAQAAERQRSFDQKLKQVHTWPMKMWINYSSALSHPVYISKIVQEKFVQGHKVFSDI